MNISSFQDTSGGCAVGFEGSSISLPWSVLMKSNKRVNSKFSVYHTHKHRQINGRMEFSFVKILTPKNFFIYYGLNQKHLMID